MVGTSVPGAALDGNTMPRVLKPCPTLYDENCHLHVIGGAHADFM